MARTPELAGVDMTLQCVISAPVRSMDSVGPLHPVNLIDAGRTSCLFEDHSLVYETVGSTVAPFFDGWLVEQSHQRNRPRSHILYLPLLGSRLTFELSGPNYHWQCYYDEMIQE